MMQTEQCRCGAALASAAQALYSVGRAPDRQESGYYVGVSILCAFKDQPKETVFLCIFNR